VRSIANLFNFGVILILISFAVLWGAHEFWVNRFFYSKRAAYAIGLTATIILCVYYSFFKESYLMTLVSLMAEICFMAYFIASYFPGGIEGVTKVLSAAW